MNNFNEREAFERWFCKEKCYDLNPVHIKAQRIGNEYADAPKVTAAWHEWQWNEAHAASELQGDLT